MKIIFGHVVISRQHVTNSMRLDSVICGSISKCILKRKLQMSDFNNNCGGSESSRLGAWDNLICPLCAPKEVAHGIVKKTEAILLQ